jgi:hypothetical protein
VSHLALANATMSNANLQSTDWTSYGVKASDMSSGKATFGSLYLDVTQVSGSYNVNDSLVIRSGSNATELLRLGTYTRIKSNEVLNNSSSIFPFISDGTWNGNSTATTRNEYADLPSIPINALDNIFNNQLTLNFTPEVIEGNNISDPYSVSYTVYLSMSWNPTYTPGTDTSITTLAGDVFTISSIGTYARTYSVNVTTPTRLSNTLYMKLQYQFTSSPTV